MGDVTRLAVIGVGLIGARHLSLIAASEACEVVAAADSRASASLTGELLSAQVQEAHAQLSAENLQLAEDSTRLQDRLSRARAER